MTTTLATMWHAATETDLRWVILAVGACFIFALVADKMGETNDYDN